MTIPILDRHPTLASSCARAATAAAARVRIDFPDLCRRDARVIARDQRPAGLARQLATDAPRWRGGHFLEYQSTVANGDDARLRTTSGSEVLLSDELADADVVVMLAAAGASAE